ncbi:MAG: hydroxysqualene dehydroxylase HpnE [Acidimicrobiales bacterium]
MSGTGTGTGTGTGRPRVVIVGGGLAGLSAAVACAEKGAAVTLLEARPRLGGATWSFERRGLWFDNGQHVHLRCCVAYRSWLDRLGTSHLAPFAGPLAIPVLRPSEVPGAPPSTAWIKRNGLPAPAHLARSLLSYGHLSLVDRLRLGRAAFGLRLARLDDPRLDSETFADWLRRHGQSEVAISRLWGLITLPTTNSRPDEVSLALAAKVFQAGLLTDTGAADIAWSQVPLSQLHVEPARRLLESLGAQVRLRAKVTEILVGGAGQHSSSPVTTRGVVVDGELLEAESVILAVPHEAAAGLLPGEACRTPHALHLLGTAPIVNVHLVFDRKVMGYQMAAAIDSPVQFVFDRTPASGLEAGPSRQVVAVSLSGADAEIGERPEVLIDRQLSALGSLFAPVREAEVLDAVVTREHDATFRGVPGTRSLRLGPVTGVRNLVLAGAWTDTGWPATMEGAVRSGRAAADVALVSVGYQGLPSCFPRAEVTA